MLGEVLREAGAITAEQLAIASEEQEKTGRCLSSILVSRGYITEQKLLETLESASGIPGIRLDGRQVEPGVARLVPAWFAKRHNILPISRRGNRLTLAMADPLDFSLIEEVRAITGLQVIPVVAPGIDLERFFSKYAGLGMDYELDQAMRELPLGATDTSADKPAAGWAGEITDAPAVKVVNLLLSRAIAEGASDIHIQPEENEVRIRFRIDGVLFDVMSLPRQAGPSVVSRIKIMAELDIAEKRLPQDGRIRMKVENRDVDFRVSTIPILYGEKVVLRVLDQTRGVLDLDELQLTPLNRDMFESLLACPHGIILVTGPTGSGKTTTLYAMLSYLNSSSRNVITLEDPVEYSLPGISQVQINPRIGLTFAVGLRAVLRQDPNIIMVGEIRDVETARLATRAAMTGHLVLSTLHTNTALGSLPRLCDMGVEPYLIASSLRGVVAQRLVRMVCSQCARGYILDHDTAARLGISDLAGKTFYRGRGCGACRMTGYRGRVALQEILVVNKEIQKLMLRGSVSDEEMESVARNNGLVTLWRDGVQKAARGITTLEEVMKAVYLGD